LKLPAALRIFVQATDFPIAYEPNPVGKGFVTAAAQAIGRPLPNIEYPDQTVGSCTDQVLPAGFGRGHPQPLDTPQRLWRDL